MHAEYDISLEKALSRMLDRLIPLAPIYLPVENVVGLVAAIDNVAEANCPCVPTSLKDGYAVVSTDLDNASDDRPVKLRMCGRSVAGEDINVTVKSGTAVKIMTGAKIPFGANAVIAGEFTKEKDGWVLCYRDTSQGRNMIGQGHDVMKGKPIIFCGEVLTPAKTGLLAAGGISTVRVHPRPRIGLIAIGDEIVRPGKPIMPGQVYASNLVTLLSWLRHFHMEAKVAVVRDQAESIVAAAEDMFEHIDVLITSGGAWKSDRDLTIKVMKEMGGNVVFHRVRMGPGKAVALVLLKNKTVFCLPGGPPSNEIAFLQIVLPSLFRMAGKPPIPFEHKRAILTKTVGGDKDWTQFFYAVIKKNNGQCSVEPLEMKSRLKSQANANALIKVREGIERLNQQTQIQVQVLFGDTF